VNRTRAFFANLHERAASALLWFYKRVLAPAMHASVPGACPFQPTCSDYASIAVAEHGVLRGALMAAWRVLRCNPLSRGGFDPVPAKAAYRVQGTECSERTGSRYSREWTEAQVSGNR
jgi:uncharacterized protein